MGNMNATGDKTLNKRSAFLKRFTFYLLYFVLYCFLV